MKTDKNTVIGFVLLGILFIAMFWFNSSQQQAVMAEQRRTEDSIARIKATHKPIVDTATARLDSMRRDTMQNLQTAGTFEGATFGAEQLTTVENELIKVTFTNKGAQVKSVELKKYKSFDSTNVRLGGTGFDNLSYTINTSANQAASTATLFFSAPTQTTGPGGSTVLTYTLNS
ncbi:MAG: inner rane protein translocase component YidC, long form, partial [Segetibacter sp.]|nr:inner rane protein translocase component YidC, long form [Segetibacter sp.]